MCSPTANRNISGRPFLSRATVKRRGTNPVTFGTLVRLMSMRYSVAFLCALFFAVPLSVSLPAVALAQAGAATDTKLEVTGWIPYWRVATGTTDTLPHLDNLAEVNPFVFSLRGDGTLFDNGTAADEPLWAVFNAQAKAKGVRVIPTLMSGDRETMHKVLSDETLRNK